MKLFVILALTLVACDFPIPDEGCAKVTKVGNTVHIEYCDGGIAGEHAHGGAGASGAGMGGAGQASGSSGGSGAGGSPEPHMHGGLPVVLPLPAPKPGRTDEYLVRAESAPKKDAGGIGAARTRCFASHYNFDDFIVYPGQPGLAHAHMYFGAGKFDAFGLGPNSDATCRGAVVNLSAYWVPALLDPQGKVIPPTYADFYYKQGNYDISGPPTNFVPQPKGLKLIAGSMLGRPESPQSRAIVGWSCGESDGAATSAGIPANCSTPSFHLHMPYCWNGKDLDSADHKSHVQYPSGGKCPAGFPVLIPAISYHIYFRNVSAGSRLSCDAATGQGGFCGHGDIVVAWKESVLKSMVDKCVNTGLSCGSDLVGDGTSLGIFSGN